jgi:hypothetical protein
MQTLTKKDKIIFSVLLLLFIIPEIVWGMISKYWFYSLFGTWSQVKENVVFISTPLNAKLYFFILLAEAVSLLYLLCMLIKVRKKITFMWLWLVILLAIILSASYVLFISSFSAFGSLQMTI